MSSTCKRISKKKCQVARKRATALIGQVRKELKAKYKFDDRLVGSGNWGTMIEDKSGKYDLDYQLLLTKNSSKYKDGELNNPTQIKNDFFNAFNSLKTKTETFENSTTAITLVNVEGHKYSIDFVIIKVIPENNEIIRRNNKKETPQKNEFTWNKLPKRNEAFDRFKNFKPEEKKDVIENYVVPKKCVEKSKDDSDPTIKSSTRIFVEEVNEYYDKKINN